MAGPSKRHNGSFELIVFLVVLLVVVLAVTFLRQPFRLPGGGNGLDAGEIMPPIRAKGWLNGPAPTEATLAGKVLVVHAWASW